MKVQGRFRPMFGALSPHAKGLGVPTVRRTEKGPVPSKTAPDMENLKPASALVDFLARYRAALVILSGEARGMEYRLDQRRTALGRGPGVDLALDDASLRCRHALVEFRAGHFVLCDFDGEDPAALELKDGDRFRLGALELQFTLNAR